MFIKNSLLWKWTYKFDVRFHFISLIYENLSLIVIKYIIDIKPHNILIFPERNVLTDFGVAKFI